MKNIKWMFAVLAAVFFTVPALAQGQTQSARTDTTAISAAIERAAIKAVRQHQQKVCCRCGEEIYAGQHCAATGYTSLCTAQKSKPASYADSSVPSVCPKCGENYTIDEKYHGVKHVCTPKNTPAEKAPVCCRCGEEIYAGQHCAATGYTSLCTAQEYEPAPRTDSTPSVCPKCGENYTIDEKYHGVKHVCTPKTTQPKDTVRITTSDDPCSVCGRNAVLKATTYQGSSAKQAKTEEFCIYCGKEITASSQKCTASAGAVCSMRCPECGLVLSEENLGPDGMHRCKFKFRIKPVAHVK